MARMDKVKLDLITELLYDVVPKDWVYSISAKEDTTAVLTISGAPVNLLPVLDSNMNGHFQVDHDNVVETLRANEQEEMAETFERIINALRSADSLDDGHYIEINIGTPDFIFLITEEA